MSCTRSPRGRAHEIPFLCDAVTAVFFDLDNTLIDHSGAERSASILFYESVAGRTSASSPEDFAALWNRAQGRHMNRYLTGELTFQQQRRERICEILESDLENSEADGLFSVYLGHYENSWQVFPDVIPCLDSLSADHVAVITNGDPAQQRKKLIRTGLADRFADLISSGEFGHTKPDPRIFHHACERAGVRPADAVHIGDSLTSDYEGACAAGLHGILLVRDSAAPVVDSSITMVRSLQEVPSMVVGAKQ